MNINAEWHKANRMPQNPTLEERINWHIDHAKNCQCRPMPEKLLKIVKERERS